MSRLTLVDDGTLDTVFACDACGREVRYAGDHFERDESGYLPDTAEADAAAEHEEECEGPEDTSHYGLACRWHGGQWSSLYAFLSSGTVTQGLACEIRECITIARKQDEHPAEVQGLEDFEQWAEQEEKKILDTNS